MSTPKLRGMELRIAEDMTSLLDFLSRLQGAIEDGNWHYARHYRAGRVLYPVPDDAASAARKAKAAAEVTALLGEATRGQR